MSGLFVSTLTAEHRKEIGSRSGVPGELPWGSTPRNRRPIRRKRMPLHVKIALLSTATIVVATVVANSPDLGDQAAMAPDSGLDCSALTGHASGLEPAQERNAKIITAVAHTRGLGDPAATIAVTAALAESTLYNYANDGRSTMVGSLEGRPLNDEERAVARRSMDYPHDRVGDNLDSIGLFQQRPMTGWGPPEVLVDPVRSAGRFFDELVEVPQWKSRSPWDSAQAVQASPSSDGEIYRRSYLQATGIVAAITAEPASPAQSSPLPGTEFDGDLCRPAESDGAEPEP